MEVEKLIGAVASALNLNAQELIAELKDGENWADGADGILRTRVKAHFGAEKKAQENRGRREQAEIWEKLLGKHGFDNPDGLKGEELITAAVTHFTSSAEPPSGNPAALSREELLKMKEVKALVDEGKRKVAEQLEAAQKEFSDKEKAWKQQRVKDIAAAKLPKILEEGKVVLDTPGVDRQKRLSLLSRTIDWDSVGIDDEGELYFAEPDGSPKSDNNGRAMDFSKTVLTEAIAIFGVHKVDPSKSGGSPAGQGTGAAPGSKPLYTFASRSELDAALANEPDVSKRSQMRKDFLAANNPAPE